MHKLCNLNQVWAGPLTGYRVALLLVNRGPWRVSITADWDDIGIPPNSVAEARDLWEVPSVWICWPSFYILPGRVRVHVIDILMGILWEWYREFLLIYLYFLQHKTLRKLFVGNLTATMNSHACKMYVLKPIAWGQPQKHLHWEANKVICLLDYCS